GKNLLILARVGVDKVLHFRIFDTDCKRVVDTNEKSLQNQVGQVEELKNQLNNLWTVPVLSKSDKDRVISSVTSIVGHTRDKGPLLGDDPVAITLFFSFLIFVSIFGTLSSLECSRSICMAYDHNDNIENWFRGNQEFPGLRGLY